MTLTSTTFPRYWSWLWLFCFGIALIAPRLIAGAPQHFLNLARILAAIYAVLTILVLPAAAFSRLIAKKSDMQTGEAVSFGLPFSIIAVTLTCYWASRLTGFHLRPVALQALLLSLVLFWFSSGRRSVSSSDESHFKDRRQKIVFVSLLLLFLLSVWLPFSGAGQITSKGVIIPKMGDWALVYSDITALVNTGVPPRNPFLASSPLIYYYLFHLYAAIYVVASGSGFSIQQAGVFAALAGAAACFVCFFAIARRWLKDFGGAAFATFLVTLVSGFDLIPSIIVRVKEGAWPPSIDYWTNWTRFMIMTPLAIFQWLPQHALGALCFFLILFFLSRGLRTWLDRALCALSWAALFGFSSFAALGGGVIIFFVLVVEGLRTVITRPPDHGCAGAIRLFLTTIAAGAVGLLMVSPIYWKALFLGTVSYTGNSIIREIRLPSLNTVKWLSDYVPPNIIAHLLGLAVVELLEMGPLLILGTLGILLMKRWSDPMLRRILLIATICSFIWVNVVNMGGNNAGECSSKVIAILLMWMLAVWAGLLYRERNYLFEKIDAVTGAFLPRNRWRKGKRRFLLLTGRFFFYSIIVLGLGGTVFGLGCLASWDYLPIDEYIAYLYIREETPPESLFQRGPNFTNAYLALPHYAWRLTPYANEFLSREYLVDEQRIQRMRRELEEAFRSLDARSSWDTFKRNGADYIFIGPHERRRYGDSLEKFDLYPQGFRKVWEKNRVAIYKVL